MKDGGPAFPRVFIKPTHSHEEPGMSLRDYFAAMALQGLICSPAFIEAVKDVPDDRIAAGTAAASYDLADAMLAEREKQ